MNFIIFCVVGSGFTEFFVFQGFAEPNFRFYCLCLKANIEMRIMICKFKRESIKF